MNNTTLSSDNLLRFRKNLDRQTAKISALSSRNVSKYEFLTGKDILPDKGLLETATALKRSGYSPLGKELKIQISTAEKQYYSKFRSGFQGW